MTILKTIPAVSSSSRAALRDVSVLGIPPAITSVIETLKSDRLNFSIPENEKETNHGII